MDSGKIRVLIADDHKIFCESLALLIAMKAGAEVVGVAYSAEQAIDKVEQLNPDVVLMDIEMGGLDGIDATRKIKEKHPRTEVIILTMHANDDYVAEAINAGAKGYVLKDSSSFHILEAIQAVGKDEIFLDAKSSYKMLKILQKQARTTLTNVDQAPLGEREIEVLKLIREGYTNKEIAGKLFISPHTVRNHIAGIFSKLNCSTRTNAVREAQNRKLI